jgi:DNA-binding IclR family transcriptional regulator
MSASKATRDYTVPAVERAVRIMTYLKHRHAGVSQIADELAITRSNCFAILKTLLARNLLAFRPDDKTYSLGLGLLELGGAISKDFAVIGIVRPFLLRHVHESKLTTFLVWRGGERRLILLDKEEAPGDVRLSISVGTRLPITHGASGRCFLAFLPDDERERLIEVVGIHKTTEHTITDPARYRAEIARIQRAGYVTSVEESTLWTNGLSAPVFDSEGKILLVLTALALTASMTPSSMRTQARALRGSADRVTRALGGTPPRWKD